MDVGSIIAISVAVLIVLIVGGFLLGLFGVTSGYARHYEELRQADELQEELRAENPELNYDYEELDDGNIKLIHAVSDATAYFDHDKRLLYLESDELDDRTEACSSQAHAEMAFEDYLRGIYDPDPAELNDEG